jgi:hypothetical protein
MKTGTPRPIANGCKKILHLAVIALILIFVGPEIGIGIELIGLLDMLGVELFFVSVAFGIWMPIRIILLKIRYQLERVDPYFFVPTRRQIQECPGILAHIIPGFVLLVVVICEANPPIVDI